MINKLYESTVQLYNRFGVEPGQIDGEAIFMEEVAELIEAADGGDRDAVLAELPDVFVTALYYAWAYGITAGELTKGVEAVIAKNDAKDIRSHRFERGKIRRLRE